MKKLVSVLVVLAMILTMAPAIFATETGDGSWDNPFVVTEMGDFSVDYAGGWDGYNMVWTAPESGTLTLTMNCDVWMYYINNVTANLYGDYHYHDGSENYDDPVPVPSQSVDVLAGDEIQICVSSYDPEGNPPAATLAFNFSFVPGEVERVTQLSLWATPMEVTIAAGDTAKYNLKQFAGETFQVIGEGAYIIYNDVTYSAVDGVASAKIEEDEVEVTVGNASETDATYTLWYYIPVGTYDNPEAIELGNHTAPVPGGYDGYNYKWTAPANGKLTLTINADGFYYYMGTSWQNNVYGDSASGAANSASLLVSAGDVVTITINTAMDPATYDFPAGEINFDLSFEEGEFEQIGTLYYGENNIELAEGDLNGSTWTYTPYESGTLNVTITGLMMYDSYFQEWTECTGDYLGMAFGRGSYKLLVNGVDAWSHTQSIEVVAGEPVTIQLYSSMGSLTSGVLNITMGENGGDEPVNPGEPDGSMDNPYPIEIPFAVDLEFGHDVYYSWTATQTGTIYGYYSEGCYISITNADFEKFPDQLYYEIYVTEGEEVIFNLWSTSAAGSYELTWEPHSDEGGEEGGEDVTGEVIASGSEQINSESEYASVDIEWTAPSNGKLVIHMGAATPGWYYCIDGVTLNIKGSEDTVNEYDVVAGTTYYISLGGYNPAGWSEADCVVTYEISFVPAGGEVEVPNTDYEYADGISTTGEHVISMKPNTNMTVVEFAPTETGKYTITANGEIALVGYMWVNDLWDVAVKSNTIEWECTSVGQTIIIGFAADVTLNITKAEVEAPVEIPLYTYENKAELDSFVLPEGAVVGSYVDVYGETHTAVLGEDGYYHLDSADGAILLIDLNYLTKLTDALNEGRCIMYAYTTDENGNQVKYDIAAAVQAYEAAADENGYYPVTEDIIFFYQVYAVGNGVPQYVLDEGYNADCAWMFACITMTLPEADPLPPTGDLVDAIIAVALISAMSIVALPVVKKHF